VCDLKRQRGEDESWYRKFEQAAKWRICYGIGWQGRSHAWIEKTGACPQGG